MQDRLVKLLKEADENTANKMITDYEDAIKDNADYLLANGVIVLPCKVGDKVWCISNYTKPKEFQITILTMSENHYSFVIEANKGVYRYYCDKDSVGKYVFFTKEEAENALAKMKGGAEL